MMDNTNVRKVAVVLGVVLTIFVGLKAISEIKAMSYIGKNVPMINQISVTGKGEVIATPDIASFSFGVSEEAPVVADAQKKATDKMNAILDYVKKAGIEDKDVKTSSYNIYPRYDYVSGANGYGGKQVLAAYVVSQNVEVKVRKIEDAGKLLSGVGEFGATNVSGLSFIQDDQDKLVREARDKAIEDARNQAKSLAKSLGVRLGSIVSYYENPGYPGPMYYGRESAVGMGGDAMVKNQSAPSVPGGENKITSNVTITYEIK
jgi:uncharacterized protein YggE